MSYAFCSQLRWNTHWKEGLNKGMFLYRGFFQFCTVEPEQCPVCQIFPWNINLWSAPIYVQIVIETLKFCVMEGGQNNLAVQISHWCLSKRKRKFTLQYALATIVIIRADSGKHQFLSVSIDTQLTLLLLFPLIKGRRKLSKSHHQPCVVPDRIPRLVIKFAANDQYGRNGCS